ncbi:MAG TPA: amino acid ABC transporter ATP-binding protein [Acidisoma sp.]|nr:amino acid ABC transporter ATP-binding protein [Acidisoma sp.]HTI03061.1 amino acid ABC transporter ATP-binding protein [Acidisoma sp.]
MSEAPMIAVRQLHKSFGNTQVLRGVDLTVHRGEITFIIGPSGGGKSTLLRCINFLDRPTSGEITFGEERLCSEDGNVFRVAPDAVLRRARSRMPMVFQHFNLLKHRTVLQNVIEGPVHVLRRRKAEVIPEAQEFLRRVGLLERQDFYPDQLSGGQKQRVAIARALAMQPALILFDEPTSALDPELVSGVLETIRALATEGRTMIIVTHEMSFARRLAHRVHFCAEGQILESGPPEAIFETPQNPRLASFIQSIAH